MAILALHGKGRCPMANPYIIEGIAEDPQIFFGRRMHLRRLCRHAKEMNCVSVVGPPGIGKSSLLYQLTLQEELQETHASLYLDLSDVTLQTDWTFLREVIWGLGQKVGRMFAGATIERLGWVLEILQDEEKRDVLLCLDDFDQFVAAPGVSYGLLDELRQLGFARRISIVVSSLRPMEELAREGFTPRIFPQLFDEQLELSLLSAREAEQLIREPASREGVEFPPRALELARELGGRYPLFLQLAGYYLFEQALSPGEIDLEAVREQFAEAAFPNLHRLWGTLSTEEREACRYYAGAAGAWPPAVSTRQELIRKGILERRGGEYHLFSEHFEEVVRRQRRDLEEPLSVPKEAQPPEEVAPEKIPAEAAAPSEVETELPKAAPAEVTAPPVEERPAPVEAEVGPPTAPTLPTEARPEPSAELSPQELTSLSALGCYVMALTLDFLFIMGIVAARSLFQLPTRQMYILIGVAAIFPFAMLLINRLTGQLSARLFAWFLRRLEHR